MDKILKDPKRGLYCFDWDKIGEDLAISGISAYDNFFYIELNITPCQYLHTWWGSPDTIHEDCIRDKEQQVAYVGNMRAMVYMSEQIFQLSEYGENIIQKRSRIHEQQMDIFSPTFLSGMLRKSLLEDEVSFLQYGQEEHYEFYNYELPIPKPSSWSNYPSEENPLAFYKFGSVEINLSQDLIIWQRETYSILDLVGDVGGLFDGLRYLFAVVVAPFSSFALQSKLLASFFKFKPS